MEFYTEPERKIEIADRADVIVAGGGPAGYSAAIAAARNGADTILIEQHNCVGGMATTGMMSHFTGGCDSVLFNEMMDRVQKEQGGIFCKSQGAGRYQIYHELLDVPNAEVEPFVVARWELILRRDKRPRIQCSNCKRVFKYHKDATLWRCPQCGAHMGGDE